MSRQAQISVDSLITESFRDPRPYETPSYRHISESLLIRSLIARHLDLALETLENDHTVRDNLPQFYAILWLRQRHAMFLNELARAACRHEFAYVLHLGRSYPGVVRKRERIKLIKTWQNYRRSTYENYANNMFVPGEFQEVLQGEEAQAHIRLILDDVLTVASAEMNA